jgi:hypothetical protein
MYHIPAPNQPSLYLFFRVPTSRYPTPRPWLPTFRDPVQHPLPLFQRLKGMGRRGEKDALFLWLARTPFSTLKRRSIPLTLDHRSTYLSAPCPYRQVDPASWWRAALPNYTFLDDSDNPIQVRHRPPYGTLQLTQTRSTQAPRWGNHACALAGVWIITWHKKAWNYSGLCCNLLDFIRLLYTTRLSAMNRNLSLWSLRMRPCAAASCPYRQVPPACWWRLLANRPVNSYGWHFISRVNSAKPSFTCLDHVGVTISGRC